MTGYRIALIFILLSLETFGMKGRLLLIGGGSEQIDGWSTPAYQWAVDKSANKRIAIIGTSSSSTWLRNYFINSLGALTAKDFLINSNSAANMQAVYDSLMTYDVIFFRGGDQSLYYNYYKDSKVAEAVQDKFEQGGVIAGTSAGLHILSGVVYAALNESITPEEAISNVKSDDITLVDDFLNLFPGYIFDSHVAERGRLPRTIAFMARWEMDHQQKIKALAMDDLTAMTIDTNEIGTLYGTGVAGIYETVSKKNVPYKLTDSKKLITDSVRVKHLLNGWKYDFRASSVIKPSVSGISMGVPLLKNEQGAYTVFLTASDNTLYNSNMLARLVRKTGKQGDRIIIISDDTTKAFAVKSELKKQGASRVNVVKNTVNDSVSSALIQNATKFIFTGNTFQKLKNLFATAGTGMLLAGRIKAPGVVTAFLGDNARFAGGRMLSENYNGIYTAYNGNMSSSQGFGLLRTSIIFPGALDTDDNKENAACAIPYFMLKDTLVHGIMLTGDCYLQYKVSPDGKAHFTSGGSYPAIIIKNEGNTYAFSNTTSKNNGTQKPRQIAGFDSLYISMVDTTTPYLAGSGIVYKASADTIAFNENLLSLEINENKIHGYSIYPNPFEDKFFVRTPNSDPDIKIYDIMGRSVDYQFIKVEDVIEIEVNGLQKVYIMEIRAGNSIIKKRLVVGVKN